MKTLTLEGSIISVDTRTVLTTQGSVTAPSLVTPAGATKIDKLFISAAAEGLAAGSATFFIRIGGNSIRNGEQVIAISAAGTSVVQAGSDAAPQQCRTLVIDDLDIECGASDTVSVSAEMAGNDLGTARVVATLVFA